MSQCLKHEVLIHQWLNGTFPYSLTDKYCGGKGGCRLLLLLCYWDTVFIWLWLYISVTCVLSSRASHESPPHAPQDNPTEELSPALPSQFLLFQLVCTQCHYLKQIFVVKILILISLQANVELFFQKKNRGALPSRRSLMLFKFKLNCWRRTNIFKYYFKYFIQTVATWMFVPWRLVKQMCWSVNIRFLIMKSFNLHFSLY